MESEGAANRMSPFGPGAEADATRQAQQQMANDFPIYFNANQIICQAQSETLVLMGKNFEAQAQYTNILARRMLVLDKPT